MHISKEFYDQEGRIFASSFVAHEQGLLMDVWGGEISDAGNVEAVLSHCEKQINEQDLNYWLCDLCNLKGDFSGVANLAMSKLTNILDEGKIRKFAFISRRGDNIERAKITRLLKQYDVNVKIFATFTSALEWLMVPEMDESIWEDAEVLNY